MNVHELQQLLATYPPTMPVRLQTDGPTHFSTQIIDFTEDNIVVTSDTAYVDDEAPKDEWDSTEGKIELGDGEQYLLLNPTID